MNPYYPDGMSIAEISAMDCPDDIDFPHEVSDFDLAFDALMRELERELLCPECLHNGLCIRCGGYPPCCEDCSWSGLCRWCNGTGRVER